MYSQQNFLAEENPEITHLNLRKLEDESVTAMRDCLNMLDNHSDVKKSIEDKF